jgi:hypothetical protein
MFDPITTPGQKRSFLVYDLEWYPETYEVRLVGVHDGIRYRAYPTVDAFLDAEMTRANEGSVFFAHAGGLADVQFVLERMLRDPFAGWQINAAFSGSSAIIVKAQKGRNAWMFADSYWLLRDKLAKIGKSIGMLKGGGEHFCSTYPACGHDAGKCIFWAPFGILKDYNEQDCAILWHALNRFQDELLGLGGELCLTVASCAMRLFRGAYLKRPIPTDKTTNEIARNAYIASRVEVFRQQYSGDYTIRPDGTADIRKAAGYYDVNSSFPASMCKPQPGRILSVGTKWSGGPLALVQAKVTVPEMEVPPIPMRTGARVYFPTGSWTGWFSGVDLRLVEEANGRVDEVFQSYEFEPFEDFRAYVEQLYEMRRSSKDDFRKLLLKYLLNSCYGKTAEVSEKDTLVAGKPPKAGSLRDVRSIAPGVWIGTKIANLDHVWVPIAMNITAESRALLTRGIWKAGRVYYCDTDSITTDSGNLGDSDKLGELKHEHNVLEARWAAAKLYRLLAADPKTNAVTDMVKAKGFSPRGKKLTSQDFDQLVDGAPMKQVRMLRVREVLASGDLRPREQEVEKRVLLAERPKRCELAGGETRPWRVEELEQEKGA